MRNYSLLVGFVFSILIFSFVQNVPLASAAQGDIGTIIENLEFDTLDGISPDIIQISGDTFAVVYEGNSDNGIFKTFTIAALTGDLSNTVINSTTFDTGTVATPKILHVTDDKYLIIYEDGGAIHGGVWSIAADGLAMSEITAGAQIVSTATDPDVVRISAQGADPQIYAIAYKITGSGFGSIKTISVPLAGTSIGTGVSPVDIGEIANDVEIVKLGTGETAVVYRNSTSFGEVRIIDITDNGATITVPSSPATVSLNSETVISSSSDLDFVHVTGDIYAVAWSDGTDGKIETLTIPADGSSIATTSIGASFGTNVVDPTLLQTNLGTGPFPFLVAYHDATGGDLEGIVKSFVISNTGTVGTIIDTLVFDIINGQTPSLAHRIGNFYAVAYQGNGANGFVSSFSIGTSDTTAPTTSAITITETDDSNTDDFSNSGEEIVLTFTVSEPIQTPTVTFPNLADTADIVNTAGNTWTATVDIAGGDTEGLLTFTINFSDLSGNTAQRTQADITNFSSVTVDLTAPLVVSAVVIGDGDLNILYSEPVISTNTAHYTVDWPDGSTPANPTNIFGSGTSAILLVTAANDPEGNDDIDYSITSGVLDRAENPLATVSFGNPSIIGTAFVQPVLTSTNNAITLPQSTLVTTITATTVSPEINLSGLSGGAGSATFPADITVNTANAVILFPSGVTVGSLPTDEIIEVSVSTKTANTSVLPSGETAGIIIELGDPNDDEITFNAPVRVILTGQGGNTAFIVTSTTTVLVPDCTDGTATTAPTNLSTTSATLDTSHCTINDNFNLVIWTRHFTGFGSSSPSSSGGGGGGDNTSPSFTSRSFSSPNMGFAGTLVLDPTKTVSENVFLTGETIDFIFEFYENSGTGVQHIELVTNIRDDQTIYDSELWIEYNRGKEPIIRDPEGYWSDAVVIVESTGFENTVQFSIVFEKSMETSDIIVRLWDINRNSVDVEFENVIKVIQDPGIVLDESESIVSEPTPGISEPTPGISEPTPGISEPTPGIPGAVPGIPEPTPGISEPTPGISEPTPEVELHPKTWTSGQLTVLKQWGGYETETASDLDVLSKFGIKGEKIPPYVKQFVKWILKNEISQEEFVNALQYLKREGILSNSVRTQSFDVPSQKNPENLTLENKFFDDTMKFEFDKNNLIKANFDDLENKVRILRALANNEIIQNEITRSNIEFNELEDPASLIIQRDSEWTHNPKIVTPFMDSLMNNESALIAKAIIENDAESLVPLISIVITNTYGVNIVITEKTQDYNQSDESWWSKTKSDSVHIMSGSGSEQQSGLYTAEVSTIINDSEGNFIGIIKAVVNFEKALILD